MDLNAEQKRIATQKPNGHMLLKGVAGSGKTSVGIYRVSFLQLNHCSGKDDEILLTTCNRTLIHNMTHLYEKMDKVKNVEFSSLFQAPDSKVDIQTVDSLMFSFFREYSQKKGLSYQVGVPRAVSYEVINEGIVKLKNKYPDVALLNQKNTIFFTREIDWIKDCLYLDIEAYQNADRKGLSRAQQDTQPRRLPKNSNTRKTIFELMQFCDNNLRRRGMISIGDMRLMALKQAKSAPTKKYTHVIINGSQDLTRSQLLFLKFIYNEKDYASFCFISDTARNIHPQSWIGIGRSYASIGFNMAGRSYALSKNFRTTTQISRKERYPMGDIAIRYTYTSFKTGLSSVVCFDPHQPDELELAVQGNCERLENDQLEKIPVYGHIAAGQPITMNQELDQDFYLPKAWVRGGDYFILKVRGDSMTGANIDDGDLVVIRCQASAENLDIAVVGIGDEGTLKRFSRMGGNIVLLSENPKYDPLLMNEEQVIVMGIVQGVIKSGAVQSQR